MCVNCAQIKQAQERRRQQLLDAAAKAAAQAAAAHVLAIPTQPEPAAEALGGVVALGAHADVAAAVVAAPVAVDAGAWMHMGLAPMELDGDR